MAEQRPQGVRRRSGRPAKRLDPSESEIAFLGYELRHARESRSVTITELAQRTSYSAQHIGAVERGEAVPSEAFAFACDDALQTTGRLAGLLPAVIREQATRRQERALRRRAGGRAFIASDDAGQPAWLGIDLERLAALGRQTSAPSPRVVDEDLEPVTASHRSLYHELTSAELEASVAGHVRLLTALLAKATDATFRPLASAVGETAGLAAWLYADLGDVPRSNQMYRVAQTALAQGEDWALSAYVHGFRASILLQR